MAKEIERKFLVKNNDWKNLVTKQTKIQQAYLNLDKERTVRVRIKNEEAFLTIKGITKGIERQEFEYKIPIKDAQAMLQICHKPIIEKTRFEVIYKNHLWEIDEFYGDNKGLIVAEIELKSTNEAFEKPDFIGTEVSDDSRYYNASLIQLPFCKWSTTQKS